MSSTPSRGSTKDGAEHKSIVTHHARGRVKERLGISKKLADKKADEALTHGIGHKEVRGRLHRYLTALYYTNQEADNIRIYDRHVYVFAGNVAITILNLPNNLCIIADKAQQKYRETKEATK